MKAADREAITYWEGYRDGYADGYAARPDDPRPPDDPPDPDPWADHDHLLPAGPDYPPLIP